MNALNVKTQGVITPRKALDMLKEGNKRFLNKNQVSRDLNLQVDQTASGQWPFAVVLGCIDSRVPAELVFDQGIGDIFSARVAGNFVNTDILGSIEYGCKVAGSKLVMVLGHEGCGAVKGACDGVELGNITPMLANLQKAVDSVDDSGDRSSANGDFVHKVVDSNVDLTIEDIRNQSAVLKEMEDAGEIMIVGAVYDVTSGKVNFK
ncbi:carbonic anhydrase family protein [Flavobacteriales bacterium]|nr:carbonic anhydrase family protein [Flavobacteriales bacterium]